MWPLERHGANLRAQIEQMEVRRHITSAATQPRHWQANPDDVRDIVRVAEHLLHDRNAAREGREALEHYVSAGLRHWQAFLLGRAEQRAS
jgi:hypothetical protein